MTTIVALLVVLAAALTALVLQHRASAAREHAWRRKEEAWGRERGDLLNRIMFLAGHPWEVPDPDPITTPEFEYVDDALDMPIEAIDEVLEVTPVSYV